MNIRYIPYNAIDKQKWDRCVSTAPNGSVYVRSVYLDHMSRHWDALVLEDYSAVFPLTWNRKWGIHYLYQPPLSAGGGLIAQEPVTPDMIGAFLEAIPPRFRLWEFNLNRGNRPATTSGVYERMNFLLSLNKPYEALREQYSENTRRNLSRTSKLVYTGDITLEEVLSLDGRCDIETRQRFKCLCSRLEKKVRGIRDMNGNILAAAVFLISHQTAYYVLVGNHPDGRRLGASHTLIDGFIRENAGGDLTLDFEGSDIPGLARFYRGFGGRPDPYAAIRLNRLPAPFRWLKR